MTVIYIVECHRDYEGSSVVAIYTGEDARAKARRRAFDENRGAMSLESHSVTQWVSSPEGEMVEGDSWYAPKRPQAPKRPPEYVEAKRRHAVALEEYERACLEFGGVPK